MSPNDGIKAYFIATSKSDENMETENEPNEAKDENNGNIDLDVKMIGAKTKKQYKKRKQINELDDYKIIRRTNMDTYRKRLNVYKKNNETSDTNMTINDKNDEMVEQPQINKMERYRTKLRKFQDKHNECTHNDETGPRFKRQTRSLSPINVANNQTCTKRQKIQHTKNNSIQHKTDPG